jgi:hypothetical protein
MWFQMLKQNLKVFWSTAKLALNTWGNLKSLANRSTLPPLPPEPGLGNWGVLGTPVN